MKKLNQLRILTVFTSFILLFTTCKKETAITENPNTFGTLYGSGGFLDLKGVVPTGDKHYLLYGTIENKVNGGLDGYVMKVDENFNIIWNKTFGGSKDDYFKSLAIDDNGNIMAVGTSNSFGPSVNPAYGHSNSLFYIVYLDKNGNKLWEKTMQANEGVGNINQHNSADKVLYLKNKTFAIAGSTGNFKNTIGGNTDYSRDVYAFGIDNKANISWRKLFYDTLKTNNYYNENCYDAALCDDGNILLMMTHFINPVTNICLIKTGYNDTGFSVNNYIWKGPSTIELTHQFNTVEDQFHPNMESLKDDKVILRDEPNGGIVLTDNKGALTKHIAFREEFVDMTFTRHSGQMIISGSYAFGLSWASCWAIIDTEGNIIKEVYAKHIGPKFNNYLYIKDVFLTPDNELLVFGSIDYTDGAKICMLKYDSEGNLIKNK